MTDPADGDDGSSPTLTLPTDETVGTDAVFCFNGYPYRFRPLDHAEYAFALSPLVWGGGDMDVPFEDRVELAEQWGPESRGVLTDAEWRDWLTKARADDRFGDDELDAVERELFDDGGDDVDGGLLDRVKGALGV
ncbi:hypothetical protein [Halobaculum lipolyticum]|uniref:Uncharacterized protein n=1 Tax=Halobaculum lipolyticum TaxID=3032001 RepID=A0ABD5WA68_9EURY|nr:hypothetical protein [Halobaculum sp. DT31]